ncbi:MAG TPA: hypothetical protein VK752_05215 [Bryobacteraceae bacterium]|jgi:hypothetical protein|nr:hypothetical protein [Bryobacteraceae bacterium]
MSNFKQPDSGETISGPLTMLNPDGGYSKLFDGQGVLVAPQAPLVQYSKPPGVSAATPSNGMVQQLCTMLAPLAAEALMKNSAFLSRICLMPQVPPVSGLGYSSLAASYKYTFGSTAVTVSPTTRNTYSETLPVDLTISNPTLVADLANRMGAQLAGVADIQLATLGKTGFTTNAAQGTAATLITNTVMQAALALVANTGEPVFLALAALEIGLVTANTTAPTGPTSDNCSTLPVVPYAYGGGNTEETLANGATPTPSTQGVWIIPCSQIGITGTGTQTLYNLMFTPSALAAVFEIETNINNTNTTPIANCSAVGAYGNCTVTVWALNTASGVQTIYCSMVLGSAVAINANGVVVKS